jgi:hypothetical protein
MGEHDSDAPTVTATFGDRTADSGMTTSPADISTSPEALRVLERDGVEAWQMWVTDHQGNTE